jgi:hypothetical protein
MPRKKTRFVFINDNPDDQKQWLEWAERRGHSAFAVDNTLDANNIAADYYVFDISAVSGILNVNFAYSAICKVAEHHPGATMVIVSAVGEATALAVIEEVYDASGVKAIYGGWGTYELFEKAIGENE